MFHIFAENVFNSSVRGPQLFVCEMINPLQAATFRPQPEFGPKENDTNTKVFDI